MRAFICALLVLVAVPGSAAARERIETLSTRPEMVTGGDVLVRVPPHSVVRVNGRVVPFEGRVGVVSGLQLGPNTITADSARLTVVNHPITGPVFSGPHEQPFVCETETAGLGAPLDADCSIAARTREVDGVRVETGTINRGIYEIAMPPNWNRRLIYNFGGGCTDGWYRQGPGTAGVLDQFMLSHGYAVASSSLNVFGNNCQEVTAAETMMMVKEHFIETYGVPAHTQGFGCSGGSYQQHQIADDYPGLLDGILPGCSFPEVTQATVSFITDAWLLDHYFQQAAGYTDEQKRAVTGFANYATAPNVAFGARRIDPRVFCGVVPEAQRYNPLTNPHGVRCDLYDHAINIWGRDPESGFARRPLDNVGIQYGLKALNAGTIDKQQFLDLNEHVGGFDADANLVPQRTVADPVAIRRAYRTGRVTNGGGGLAHIPIIDYRAYNDDAPNGDIHVRYHSFSMRARLQKANGDSGNQVMLVEDQRYGLYSTESPLLQHAILALDRWITTGEKPREGCMTRDEHPTFIAERQRRDPATRCEQLYPSASFPREVAGGPIAADVVKCRLKPIDPADYRVALNPGELQRLRAIFPGGVCDWSRPGVDQQPPAGTWLSFGPP
jgi:uncharacterized tannase-like protein DUF6351